MHYSILFVLFVTEISKNRLNLWAEEIFRVTKSRIPSVSPRLVERGREDVVFENYGKRNCTERGDAAMLLFGLSIRSM